MTTSFSFPNLSLRRRAMPGLGTIEALLDTLPHAAFLTDTNSWQILLVNAKATELTTFTRSELIEMKLTSLFPTFSIEEALAMDEIGTWERELPLASFSYRSTPSTEIYLSLTLLDSTSRWVLVVMESSAERKQRTAKELYHTRFKGALKNLTTALHANNQEEALQNALQSGSDLLGASLLAIYLADGEHFLLKRSSVWGPEEMLPDQLLAQDLMVLKEPRLWVPGKRSLCELHKIARSCNLSYLASVPIGHADASVGILAAAGEQIGPPEDVLPVLQILSDIVTAMLQTQTLTKNFEEQLRHKRMQNLVISAIEETVQDGVIVINSELNIEKLNASAEDILGYTSREVQGLPYQHILVGLENLVPPFLTSEPGFTIHNVGDVRLYRRDGQPLLAHLMTVPVVFEDQLECLLVLVEDLSQEEQYRLRNQQLEQRAILGEVTAIFAHEVRNPINNISTGLQLLGFNLAPDDPNQELIERLQQDCDRLTDLMKSVLTFAKPMEYKINAVDLGQSIRRILDRWHGHMARVNIEHSLQIEPYTPLAEGDLRALEQVWNNLISNAIQAMGQEGGTLTVKVRPVTTPDNTPRVEVNITDTGPGIPEEVRERIFEPFFTTNRNGTGLGLSITKHIVSTHKGSIKVTSIPGGTSFQVQLPVSTLRQDQTEANE